jgi:hypothetical protein
MANFRKTVACSIGAAALAASAGSALAQCNPQQCSPVGTCNGADVIVGDIMGTQNYSPVGGIDAFSLGTTSCNIGNVWLNWFANTNQHPVIGQSMYRLKTQPAGYKTFEQVGQSWLKHGFFALSQGLCCSGCQSTNGEHLGVHCSDPYTAARNGSQGGLGPKWQVNAATGAFTYPPANPGFTGSIARRLQVALSDLENTTADVLYFGACQYVTSDDAAAQNKYNNESYRRLSMSVSGGNANYAMNGTTQRARQAIRAWGDFDTDVIYSDIFVPNDGLIIVAAKATDLGDGTWHYEYAVQNMNSDRSVQALSIPVPAGVVVTNIGFHDVAYHSGDGSSNVNYSGTDWTPNMVNGSVSTGAIVWQTENFVINPSANAIRWGTMYNFRFDANVAPDTTGGVATLNFFKPGTPTNIESSRIVTPGAPPVAACPCDYNGSDTLDSQDFFDFLADFFKNSPSADFNEDTIVNSQDFFDFLGCFFAPPKGC